MYRGGRSRGRPRPRPSASGTTPITGSRGERPVSLPHYYAILGVPRSAAEEEIRRAYRSLARRHHPDRPGGNQQLMAIINRAYEVLGEAGRRAEYDASLKREAQVSAGGPAMTPTLGDTLRAVGQQILRGVAVLASDPRFWEALAKTLKESQKAQHSSNTESCKAAPPRRRSRYGLRSRRTRRHG